jgi:hypothetical protein
MKGLDERRRACCRKARRFWRQYDTRSFGVRGAHAFSERASQHFYIRVMHRLLHVSQNVIPKITQIFGQILIPFFCVLPVIRRPIRMRPNHP